MEHRQRGGEARVVEVGVEHRQVIRHHQALVGDHPAGQGRHIEGGIIGQRLFHRAPGDIQLALEDIGVDRVRTVDEYLLDRRQALEGVFTQGAVIGGYLAETGDGQALAQQLGGQEVAGALGEAGIPVQEHQAGGVAFAQSDVGLGRHGSQEAIRLLEQEAAAIA